jgi:hypothetical protein
MLGSSQGMRRCQHRGSITSETLLGHTFSEYVNTLGSSNYFGGSALIKSLGFRALQRIVANRAVRRCQCALSLLLILMSFSGRVGLGELKLCVTRKLTLKGWTGPHIHP